MAGADCTCVGEKGNCTASPSLGEASVGFGMMTGVCTYS